MKSGQRERELTRAAGRSETSIFFESPHRLQRTLEACARLCPDRMLVRGAGTDQAIRGIPDRNGAELAAHYTAHPAKGEIVFLIRAATKEQQRAAVSPDPV